ncbi:hypothetical protein COT44_02375 [Candidatus Shapirobacteria bacterium CG08_land_8_20_14_0_20_39_18]|uniref:Uncharacterized protein n=1 Tax=Candidatus Shapirobacteria bacterium CG08_land_8_20_14_0_20_39_18 TaxID=1974883 RepID=A0A2M6XDB9_9BACT|nr:MAG: hypothetical protein COT44_02375 [Candidatus Shapirobacteria bacterium CG08_land_8_20_14_0_20_39_18]PIY66153.1 MAG: hypothetical protein COY91_01645 [Candidatus Shapirobacteria bacterium CG_4_10_14_0_8_um_filter_39_15]PJE68856.1 MAG: hypothetical protein COU94_00115 [Candidatus Shapirobacteria bacterium CG10_big_fil_rev_8_21_14_0_10_38_8]
MLNKQSQTLLDNFQASAQLKNPSDQGVTVSRTVSAAAVLYEAARNAVEFRAEHLIRRAAIERILRRRLIIKSTGSGIAEALIKELLWARYLENGHIPILKIDEIQETIDKYIALKTEVCKLTKNSDYANWLTGIASCEIEKKLAPAPNREALINFVYQSLKNEITLENERDQKSKNIQVYIAVHRAYAQSDEPVIRFQLFQSKYPDWIDQGPEEAVKIAKDFEKTYQEIEKELNHPAKDRLKRFIKRECAPFLVIRDLVEEDPVNFPVILTDPDLLQKKAEALLSKRYLETQTKLRRAATRSIIYIFLTKMVLAILIEVPFDLLVRKTNLLAITINTIFPPALMFVATANIGLPDNQNTQRVIDRIKNYLYEEIPTNHNIQIKVSKPSSTAFTIVYSLTFILIFGLIIAFLNRLGFSIVSKGIFLFFLCVVSFFSYRVRLDTKDYVIMEKESALTPIGDFIFLPILRVGQWLSGELSQINFLIFIFDFIIEAPFKAFFNVAEEWIHFVRIKKEEIIV